ncbi:hypothetical protein PanWU01x14_217530 [Parasponia andersonii]|uniref:Uncharacterized protein n=1 Tax=Parasponia andersonii TaxID=3476 RepID=A0A2P5BRC6_PARAD|nr:hypothetical protein PanWU01x14_217530 [Parasponia andersonii]
MEDGRDHHHLHIENEENHHDDHKLGLNGNQNNHYQYDESASEVERATRKRRRLGNDDAEAMAQDEEEESINKDFAELVNQMNIDKNSLLDGLIMMIQTPLKAEFVRMWRILHVDYLRGRSNIAREIVSLALSKAGSS